MKRKTVYKFHEGQEIHLDEIYHLQGLAGDWFEEDYSPRRGAAESRSGLTDYLKVTRDIKFTIIVEDLL